MRETLTWWSGLTSYWVTTGPLLTATTLAGIEKLRSFSSMRRWFEAWSRWPLTRPAGRGSRSSTVGRTQSMACSDSNAVGSASARAVAPRADALAARPAAPGVGPAGVVSRAPDPTEPPSDGPVHTVWLTGPPATLSAGSSRIERLVATAAAAAGSDGDGDRRLVRPLGGGPPA